MLHHTSSLDRVQSVATTPVFGIDNLMVDISITLGSKCGQLEALRSLIRYSSVLFLADLLT
jgi:hypothetical protein